MKTRIQSYLPGDHPWQNHIYWFETIDSTNTRAKEMAANGAPHGTVLIADRQTGGRGRMGRSFHSPAGCGIYLSVILRPECAAEKLMHLTCATAVAAADGIENASGLRPGIKWTNDLVVERKKLGGILTELSLKSNAMVDYAIVGIGINCTQDAGDFPEDIRSIATSLQLSTQKKPDRAFIIANILISLCDMCKDLQSPSKLLPRYRADCITIGQEISVVRGEEIRHGKALDIDDAGGLIVVFSDGHRETVSSGEVSIRGMYGYA
ncbi:MAG: biotin--[acetyl-CoA-carboxylase] ligase [Ruminococcaceae bacterium]|nr:biotin--[acetyl-CoA-carboxylase] ligase [Oscillospiraceae bacterium]